MSGGDDETTVDVRGLEALLKAIKNAPVGRIGVLGTNAQRSGPKSNAQIGAAHEFGEGRNPVRSFLRMPLTMLLSKELEKLGAFGPEVIAEVIRTGSFVTLLKKIMIVGESLVLGAFDSGGYGIWKPSDMRFKKNKQTLVETQQLRNSITSEVKDNAV